jgi:GNAT superfamily N-acetyltransferase
VGHIALASESEDELVASAARGVYRISTFYVSRALQGGGLGRAAMDAVERMAVKEPLCAKVLTLDTMAREHHYDLEMWADFGMTQPKVCMYGIEHWI